ncbi:MAG: hypothetical protein AAFY08_14420 [Planctomycetota bacterium]
MPRSPIQPGPFATLPRLLAPLALLALPLILIARLLNRLGVRDGHGYRLAIVLLSLGLILALAQLLALLLTGPVQFRALPF